MSSRESALSRPNVSDIAGLAILMGGEAKIIGRVLLAECASGVENGIDPEAAATLRHKLEQYIAEDIGATEMFQALNAAGV